MMLYTFVGVSYSYGGGGGAAVAWWLMPRTPDPEVEVRAPLGSKRVVSLSKAHLLPKKYW